MILSMRRASDTHLPWASVIGLRQLAAASGVHQAIGHHSPYWRRSSGVSWARSARRCPAGSTAASGSGANGHRASPAGQALPGSNDRPSVGAASFTMFHGAPGRPRPNTGQGVTRGMATAGVPLTWTRITPDARLESACITVRSGRDHEAAGRDPAHHTGDDHDVVCHLWPSAGCHA